MTTTDPTSRKHPQVAAVLGGHLGIGELVTTPETLTSWYRLHSGLEFAVGDRSGRRLEVTVRRRDTSLAVAPVIVRTEPRLLSPGGVGMNDGRRTWECLVSFARGRASIQGFPTKIECTLAARQWFIAHGVSPDSPGGWL
jgi:hypothetical protein